MSFLLRKFVVLVCLICFVGVGFGLSDAEVGKISSAGPDKASVEPKAGRKVLVFTLCNGFTHGSIPYCSKAIEVLGNKTGAFSCDISDDMKVFTAENLAQYDAIIFNNTTKLTFDDSQRKVLMGFVKGGKGIVGIHAATDNFYKWPEAAEMMGGTFSGHPWRAKGTWSVKIEDADSSVTAAFEGKDFKVSDEIYRTKQIKLRKNGRVLIGLDMTDETNLNAKGVTAKDVDIPVSWIRDFGKGRVFYCGLGHNKEIFWNRPILGHYLAGIQFAIGDLKADATPIAFSSKACAAGDITGLFDKISGYEYGQSRQGLIDIEKSIKDSDSAEKLLDIEVAMGQFLATDATDASKQFVCRQLGLIGTEASVGILSQMLGKDETNDMARYALERIGGSKIDNALLDGLACTKGKAKIGIINSIGVRRMNSAVGVLSKLAGDGDKETVAAAINSLGEIGSVEAAKVLGGMISKKGVLAEDAYLRCGDQLAGDGKKKEAKRIYKKVSRKGSNASIKVAALRGLIQASKDPSDLIISSIDSKDPGLQVQAISMANMIKGSSNIKKAAGKIKGLPARGQVQLLTALSDTCDGVILPAVFESVKSGELEVRVAAIKALKFVGDPASVVVLAEKAANTKGEEQGAARGSLYGMNGKGVDEAILKLAGNADSKVGTELVVAVGQRCIGGAVDVLAGLTASKDAKLSRAAYKAIADVGGAKDVDTAIGLLVGLKNERMRVDAETTVVVLCGRTGMSAGVKKVVAALKSAGDAKTRLSLYTVLGKTGSGEALYVLRGALKDPDDEVKTAAIRALSLWPEGSAAGDLLAVVKSSDNQVHKVLALRGFIKLVPLGDKKASEKVELLKEGMGLCSNVNEKRMVLSSLSAIASVESLQLCGDYLDDASIRKEAAAAILRMAKNKNLKRKHAKELEKVLAKIKQE